MKSHYTIEDKFADAILGGYATPSDAEMARLRYKLAVAAANKPNPKVKKHTFFKVLIGLFILFLLCLSNCATAQNLAWCATQRYSGKHPSYYHHKQKKPSKHHRQKFSDTQVGTLLKDTGKLLSGIFKQKSNAKFRVP